MISMPIILRDEEKTEPPIAKTNISDLFCKTRGDSKHKWLSCKKKTIYIG